MKDEGGKDERPYDLRLRTKRFSLDVIAFYVALPRSEPAMVMGRQVLRSATSVGAHYREACRARSDAEFISKMDGALQELDESGYWFELLLESGIAPAAPTRALINEADELIRIFVTIIRKRKGD